jgi:hypothetical protein
MLTALLLTLTGRLRDVPLWAWVTVLGVALAIGAGIGIESYGQRAYARGQRDTLQQAAMVQVVATERVRVAEARTDTIIKRVVQRIAITDTLIQRVPDSVRIAYPVVDSALRSCSTLASDCAQFRADVQTERAVRDTLELAIRSENVHLSDHVKRLQIEVERRWSRVKAWLGMILSGLLAYAIGRQ